MRTDRLIFPVKLLSVSILLALILSGCGLSGPSPAAASRPLTYSADVQPLVSRSCAQPCHHPGGPGPFPLLTYQDVRKRARQIVDVTRKRYMPPWLPSPEGPRFAGERRLSDDQIALLETWVQGGMAEGEHLPAPNTPMTKDGWQLGKPDLVLSLPQPYLLPAGGTDVFRNFIFPVSITSGRYVKALEILPGNKRIVHHANLLIDRLESSRRLDAADPGVGFGGMDIEMESAQFEPDTHFLFWKPGTPAAPEPPGMSWRWTRAPILSSTSTCSLPENRSWCSHRSASTSRMKPPAFSRCCCNLNTTGHLISRRRRRGSRSQTSTVSRSTSSCWAYIHTPTTLGSR